MEIFMEHGTWIINNCGLTFDIAIYDDITFNDYDCDCDYYNNDCWHARNDQKENKKTNMTTSPRFTSSKFEQQQQQQQKMGQWIC